MKATMEFNLPEESYEYRLHVQAVELATALEDVRELLREKRKHCDLEGMTADELIGELWDRFHDIAEPVMSNRIGSLTDIADTIDPPRPEPGTVVWWRVAADDKWHIGCVLDYGIVPADNVNACWTWDHKSLEYKPARILAPDEVAVRIPPVSEWPKDSDDVDLRYSWYNDPSTYAGVTITRAEAERR